MANVFPDRDKRILDEATELAKSIGYQWITREQVALAVGCAPGTINNAFGSVVGLKRAVLQHAVDTGIVEIVAQGLADGHAIARAAPADLKARAAAHLAAA